MADSQVPLTLGHLHQIRSTSDSCALYNHTMTDDEKQWLELVERYAPRRPMSQLADELFVKPTNPEPPLIHFAIPVSSATLYKYAERHNLIEYFPQFPDLISPISLSVATEHLSEEVEYELELDWPFKITADCGLILVLYSNYSMAKKMLIDEDQEDVIRMVQEALGLDSSVRPKWYFDVLDPWEPDD